MAGALTGNYRAILAIQDFRSFWLGFTISTLGDAITRVALIWYVYDQTGSSRSVGFLMLCYTGPVIIGGLVAGSLLDRYDRRNVMLVDSLLRGVAMLAIPLLEFTGNLQLWHVYVVAAVFGALMMVSLAGGPAIVPDLVPTGLLGPANALETLSFTLASVVGPLIAGILIDAIGAPQVVLIDAISYGIFAITLLSIGTDASRGVKRVATSASGNLMDAFRLLTGNRILLVTTAMYLMLNLGAGMLYAGLPSYAAESLGGDARLFGLLLGCVAVGELIVAIITGLVQPPFSYGIAICIAQAICGFSILLLLPESLWLAALGLAISGAASGPLTIWAQTLRMQIIPAQLRGRTFALLRTLMQGGGPIGGMTGGTLLAATNMTVLLTVSALAAGLPGIAGLASRHLRTDNLDIPARVDAPIDLHPELT